MTSLFNSFFDWISSFADIIGLVTAFFAFGGWLVSLQESRREKAEEKRLNEKVAIHVRAKDGSMEMILPIKLRRDDVTRAEVMGLLGMIPMRNPGSRFSINYPNTFDFDQQMDRIHAEKGDSILVISLEPGELDQFDLSKLLPDSIQVLTPAPGTPLASPPGE
jgi:hypothetical protein